MFQVFFLPILHHENWYQIICLYVQEKKIELYQGIVKLEQDVNTDDTVQVCDRILNK